jgi:hypothetical protein
MSTKTTFKRVALVAAVAAAFGGLSTVAANAANVGDILVTAATGTNNFSTTAAATETATATSGANNYVGITVYASNTAPVAVSVTGGTAVSGSTSVTGSGTSSLVVTPANGSSTALNIPTPSAGTITVKDYLITNGVQSTTATTTLTITVSNAAVMNIGLSTAVSIRAGAATETAAGTSDSLSAVKTAGTIGGEIRVTVNDGSAAAYNGATVSATVAGSGLVSIDTSSTQSAGTVRSASLVLDGTGASGHSAQATNVSYVHIAADGTSGTGTITISLTDPVSGVTTVLATKTVTFTGSAATVTAVGNLKVLKASSAANYTGTTTVADQTGVASTIALTGFVFDSNGNKATGTVKAVSSDSTVLGTGSCVAATGADALSNEYNCPVYGVVGAASGKSATVTFEAADSTGAYTILSTPVTFTIGGAIAKTVLSMDSDSYTALAPIVFKATVTDASGNAAYDQDVVLLATPVSSIQLGGTDIGTSFVALKALIGGVATYKGSYAPAADGTFTVSATDTLTALNPVSATASVTTGASSASMAATDAANEATDAANAATDAANAAADAADAATAAAQDASAQAQAALAAVNALSAKITVLAAQIAKIIKKLGA